MSYSDEERDEILRQARETLERTANLSTTDKFNLPPTEDPLTKWQRERTAEMQAERIERDHRDLEAIERRVTANVLASMQIRIDTAVNAVRQEQVAADDMLDLVRVVEKACNDLDRLFAEVDAKLATTIARLTVVETLLRKSPGDDDKVITMPSLRGAAFN
jgi:hypothetical protein